MDTSFNLTGAVNPLAARLQIHSRGTWCSRRGHPRSLLHWLRALVPARPPRDERAPLSLRIADAQGEQVIALEDGAPLTVVFLRAGTYHVDARLDNVRRRYTMTLEQGVAFDLYLDLAPERS